MSVKPIEPITYHRARCDRCETILRDTDPERLGREMDAHERDGCR